MKSISIISDDRPGVIAEICELLAAKNVNIETIDAETHQNHGIIILTVDKYDEALNALRNSSFQAVSEDVILIRLEDRPGALAQIAKRFKDADINLKSLRIMKRDGSNSIVALSPDKLGKALELVHDIQIK
ncbi:MAG: hypothetical protein A2017_00485 [Lentisphaerae bacterium GWF2_44_16]|nr:MAG: hypothetical protein A2017_00485 [Lentisphaerae bacterium GWF2_44_16]